VSSSKNEFRESFDTVVAASGMLICPWARDAVAVAESVEEPWCREVGSVVSVAGMVPVVAVFRGGN
jgi:hypothetical protein